MKKFLITIITLSFCLGGCNNKSNESTNNQDNSYDYNASRTTISDNTTNNTNNNINTETEISSFSTKIYTPNDSARQNNIALTCSELNGTVVKPRRNIFLLQYSRKSNS